MPEFSVIETDNYPDILRTFLDCDDLAVIGVDGDIGAGKTTLADWLATRLSCSVIRLDDHAVRDAPGYAANLRIGALTSKLPPEGSVVIVEGICLLDACNRVGIQLSKLIYIKKLDRFQTWPESSIYDEPRVQSVLNGS